MERFLKRAIDVSFDDLYLDPNNPRLAKDEAPGYDDHVALFDKANQEILTQQVYEGHDVDSLLDAILAHGWMEIDAIVVWSHPAEPQKQVVVEGNRRHPCGISDTTFCPESRKNSPRW
jgi:hypothetical protein